MSTLQGLLLGALQGVAEFLPISSSGHLALAQALFGLEEVPLLYDVLLHLATLLAVVLFFRKQIWNLILIFCRLITRKPLPEDTILAAQEKAGRSNILAVIIVTVITGIIGVITSKLIKDMSLKTVGAGFLVTSVLLISTSLISRKSKKTETDETPFVSVKQAIRIGIMQGFGTLPGISRSGSTISGALWGKVDRKLAGEFSFIASIPAILGAFILEAKDLGEVSASIGAAPVIAGCIAAFVTGWFSLAFLMKLIKKGRLEWFSAYLIPLGIAVLMFM